MFADLYGQDTDRALRSRAETGKAPEPKEPGIFDGAGKALATGLPAAGLEVLRAGTSLFGWQVGLQQRMIEARQGKADPLPIDDAMASTPTTKALTRRIKSLEPNPETTGAAAQVLHGFVKYGGKAAGYALTMGPTGALMFGVDETINERERLTEQGIDAATANKAAAVHGIASVAGAALPLTGKSVAQTVGLAMAGGPVLYSAEIAGIKEILENADYQTLAAAYDPFDVTGLVVSTAAPLAFGGAAHAARASARPRMTPKPVEDAARVALAERRQQQLSGADPANAKAQADHRREVDAAAKAINEGQSVGDSGDRAILQNRDRSSPAAIAQMARIAGAPDYYRLSPGRSLSEGAPVVLDEAAVPDAQLGANDVAVDSAGARLAIRYAVVEASKLIPSHKADGTGISEYQIGQADAMRAVAGNGRIAGLQEAYRRGTANEYRQAMAADAKAHGVPAEVVDGMREPVLVRLMRRDDVTDDMGDRTNVSGVSDLSAVEQARNDSLRIRLDALEFTDTGAPTAAAVKRFVQAMPQAEQSGLMDSAGQTSKQAEDRMMAATFAAAYDDAELVHLYAAATDPEARTVVQALAAVAPEVAATRGTELDMRRPLVEAAKLAVNAKRMGIKMSDLLDQADIATTPETMAIARLMAENIRSAKRIIESLRSSARQAVDEATKPSSDMFGSVPRRALADILEADADEAAKATAAEPVQRPAPNEAEPDATQGGQSSAATPDELTEAARGGIDPAAKQGHGAGAVDQAAADVAAVDPNLLIELDDGTQITAREALAAADEVVKMAETESKAFEAATSCFLRTGG